MIIRNVIFDWSGTLVDDLEAVCLATNFALRKAGLSAMALDQFRSEFSLPFDAFYRRIAPELSLDQIEEWYKEGFAKEQKYIKVLPHAETFYNFCKKGKLKTLLLSTIHPDHYRAQSEFMSFDFDAEYVRIMDKREKIKEILIENQMCPEETIFIGDMQHDIEAAKIGRVGSCAVLTGYNKRYQLEESEPDFIVENLSHLKRALEMSNFHWPPR